MPRPQEWGSCLSISDTRQPINETQAYGATVYAQAHPEIYAGGIHRGNDQSVREGRWGPILAQHYMAPVDAVVSELVDSARGYGYHVWLSTGQWRILFAHGVPGSMLPVVRQPIVAGTPLMLVGTSGGSTIPHGHIGVQTRDGQWVDPGPFMRGEQLMEVETVAVTTALDDLQERYDDLDALHLTDVNLGARAVRLANQMRDRLAVHEGRPPTDPWPADRKDEGELLNRNFAGRG